MDASPDPANSNSNNAPEPLTTLATADDELNLLHLVNLVYYPFNAASITERISQASATADHPVECELCALHQVPGAFVHVHNVEHGDCFTFRVSPDGQRGYGPGEDSASRLAREAESREFHVSEQVVGRQHRLIRDINEAIDGVFATLHKPRAPPRQSFPSYDVYWGPQGPVQRMHVGLAYMAPKPRGPPSHPPHRKRRRLRPPMWAGRPCPRCSLYDDNGSYVHVHIPQAGLCFTFGERTCDGRACGERRSHACAISVPGPVVFPLPNREMERERRVKLQVRIEDDVRQVVRRFYGSWVGG